MLANGAPPSADPPATTWWTHGLLGLMLVDHCWFQGGGWPWERSALVVLAIVSDWLAASFRWPKSCTRSGVSNDIGAVVFLGVLLAGFLGLSGMSMSGVPCWLAALHQPAPWLGRSVGVTAQLAMLVLTLTLARWRVRTALLVTLASSLFMSILNTTFVQLMLPSLLALVLLYTVPCTFSMGEVLLCSMLLSWALLSSASLSRASGGSALLALASAVLEICTVSIGLAGLVSKAFPGIAPKAGAYFITHLVTAISLLPYHDLALESIVSALIRPSRLAIMAVWLALLTFTLLLSWLYLQKCPAPSRLQVYLNRKFYHLMTIPFFVPVLLVDHEFLSMALALMSCVFIELEAFRVICPHSVSARWLSSVMMRFKSQLDGEGPIVLSHLWLLLGCTVPIITSLVDPARRLWPLGGIASLGVLDSVAAIVGMLVGGPRWPASNKTVSGSVAGAVSMVLFQAAFLRSAGLLVGHPIDWLAMARQAIYCSLWEALSGDLNDNLTLPLVAMITVPA